MNVLGHLLLEEIKLPPGREWTDASVAWRFVRVHSGAAYWLGGDRSRPLAEGEIIVVGPEAKGVVRASQLSEVVLYAFKFAPDLLYGFFTLNERHFFDTSAAAGREEVRFLPTTHPAAKQFAGIAAHRTKHPRLSQRAEVLGLVAAVFDDEIVRHRPPASLGTSVLHRFKQLIAQMPDTEIINHSPDELARLCGCSPRHFNRLFQRHFNTSARARQTELRLLKARQLLGSSDEKIIHVALESGYRNLSLFNSLFKKRFGMTPSEWRRKAAKKNGMTGRLAAGLAVLFLAAAATWCLAGTDAEPENIARAREAVRRKIVELEASEKAAPAASPVGGAPEGGTAGAVVTNTPAGAQSPPLPFPNPAHVEEIMSVIRSTTSLVPELKPADPETIARAREALRQKVAELSGLEMVSEGTGTPVHLVLASSNAVGHEAADPTREALRRKLAEPGPQQTGLANAPAGAASTNAGPTFEIKGFELSGNTLLPYAITDPILQKQIGPAMTFDSLRQGRAELQMAYRDRGYVTVAVGLPQQQLTNGVVKIQVTEGRLAEINVLNNHYFTSNNIMRELPALHTNSFLNALVFQQELDRANANRDRQIYPVIAPGPDPATSVLDLKVKDRLPLHVREEVNNNNTPLSPQLRDSLAIQYNNLWQLNHQVGFQYSFTPQAIKEGRYPASTNSSASAYDHFWEAPLIANYSAFYRLPLSGVNGPARDRDYTLNDFGYDEATRRFRPPPPTGASEVLFFASRSLSDNGSQLQSRTLTPPVVPSSGGIQVFNEIFSRTLNPNEDIGARFMQPLPPFLGFDSANLSFGMDYKNYRSTVIQTHAFHATVFVPEFGTNGPPFIEFPSTNVVATRTTFNSLQYLPMSIGLNASRADQYGTTAFDLGCTFQFANFMSSSAQFRAVSGDTNVNGHFFVLTAGLTRERRISGDWGVRLHADGQWANQSLISNEQFALGGQGGPRAYHDGEQYGDTGWRVLVEPHSPYLSVGLVDGTAPMLLRLYAFWDYGQRYLLNEHSAAPKAATLMSTGLGWSASFGQHVDFRAQIGVALHDTPPTGPSNKPDVRSGDARATFALGVQF